MIFTTIDDIQHGLERLGYHVSLSELAWMIERIMDQKRLAELLERAHFDAQSREALEVELKQARVHVRAAHEWIDQIPKSQEAYFKPCTIANAMSRTPIEDQPSRSVTVIGKRSFANFWTDSDAYHAPTLGIDCCDLREEKKSVRIFLPLHEIMNCLMVCTGTLTEAHAFTNILTFYSLKRSEGEITLEVGSESVHHLVEIDPQGAFAVASLLTAQIRISMPAGSSQDLPFLVDKVLAPLHHAPSAPCE
jgi:hypothetical protein